MKWNDSYLFNIRINEAMNLKGRDIGNTFVILYTSKSNNYNSVPRKVPKPDWLDKKMFQGWKSIQRMEWISEILGSDSSTTQTTPIGISQLET